MVYIQNDIFNIIKEYLLTPDYYKLIELFSLRNSHVVQNEINYYFENNKIINNLKDYTNNTIFDKTIKESLNSNDTLYFSYNPNFLYKNLKIVSNINNIKQVELYIGGTLICMLPMLFYEELQKFYDMDSLPLYLFKYGIPGLEYHNIIIKFITLNNENINITYDRYIFETNIENHHIHLFTYIPSHIQSFNVKKNNNILNLNTRNYILYNILCDSKLTNIRILIRHEEINLVQYDNSIKLTYNNKKINNFINLSTQHHLSTRQQLQNIKLLFDSPYSDHIKISFVYGDVTRFKSGLGGPVFRS